MSLLLAGFVQAQLLQSLSATTGVTTNGSGAVASWADQSGNGNDAAPGVGTVYYPSSSLSVAGKAGLDFGTNRNSLVLFSAAGQDSWLDFSGAASGNSGFCVMVSFKCDALLATEWSEVIGNASFGSDTGFVLRYSNAGVFNAMLKGTTLQRAVSDQAVAPGATVVMALNYNKTTGELTFWDSLNGSTLSTTVTAADFSMSTDVMLGAVKKETRYLDGTVGEVRVYDSVLDATAFAVAQDEMLKTWAVNFIVDFDQNHDWNGTTNSTGFDNDNAAFEIKDLDNDSNDDDIVYWVPYQTASDFLSPWDPPEGYTAVLKAGYVCQRYDDTDTGRARKEVRFHGTDFIQAFDMQSPAPYNSNTTHVAFLLGVDKANFLCFTNQNVVATKMTVDTRAQAVNAVTRFALKNGSSWYVSATNWTGSTGVKSIDPRAVDWLEYYFETGDDYFLFDPSGLSPVAGSTFSDIQEVGIQIQQVDFTEAEAAVNFQLFNFKVEAETVLGQAQLVIEVSSGLVTVTADNLSVAASHQLQSQTGMTLGSWSNLGASVSGVVSTNWVLSPSEPATFYRVQSND
jgi:hypothetical protein